MNIQILQPPYLMLIIYENKNVLTSICSCYNNTIILRKNNTTVNYAQAKLELVYSMYASYVL